MRVATMLTLPLVALAVSEWDQFEQFKLKFGKTYTSFEEEGKRFEAFKASLKRVAESGMATQGVTQFSDLTPAEFAEKYLTNLEAPSSSVTDVWDGVCTACKRFPGNDKLAANSSFDWTEKGAVTHVKDQGQCGSCWSFGTTGDVEGVHFLAGNALTPLSEQELVSCDRVDHGCGGGWQYQAFEYIIKQGGLVSESQYPYTSGHGVRGSCQENKLKPVAAKISSWYWVSKQGSTESNISEQLPQVGPITIALNAAGLQDYHHGIYNPARCPPNLDHAVLIVGFGEENGQKYWKIKNSWGAYFGENGYFRLLRGVNKCGVANSAVHSKA